ncbi:MAG: metallophosphoesterase [Candidatus Micrarchaeia archaeon]|jgi:hypothetical protein
MVKQLSALCISDLHDEVQCFDFLDEFLLQAKPDLLLVCGDLTTRGPLAFAEEFAEFVKSRKIKAFAVHGNMDPLPVQEFLQKKGLSIHGKSVEFGGFKFAGWGGSNPTPNGTPCEYSEEEIANGLAKLDVDEKTVVLCHTPPFGTKADTAGSGSALMPGGGHIGSRALRAFVENKRPAALLCGHCHQSEGVEMLGATKIIKAAPLMHGKAALLQLPSLECEFLKTKRFFEI